MSVSWTAALTVDDEKDNTCANERASVVADIMNELTIRPVGVASSVRLVSRYGAAEGYVYRQ